MEISRVAMAKGARAGARVFMASFFAYFLKIVLDGLFAAGAVALYPHAARWLMKWVVAPVVLEGGTVLAMVVSVYLLVRFAAVPWWAATVGTGLLLEAWSFLSAWIMGLSDGYLTGAAIVTRVAGFGLYVWLGWLIWRKVGVKDA